MKSDTKKKVPDKLKLTKKKKIDGLKSSSEVKEHGGFANVINNILNQNVKESRSLLTRTKKSKTSEKSSESSRLIKRKKKLDWEEVCRIKPDILEREKEKKLQRIATRGVVALFNSVKEHQNKAGSGDNKKKKVLVTETKKSFIHKLNNKVETEAEQEDVTWKALRDDYMAKVSTKDWDKDDD